MGEPEILKVAVFDPKLRIYLFLQAAGLLCVLGGIVVLPLALWAAWWWARRFFDTIRCDLTTRRLRYAYGILFQRESNIPLDKIQDVTLLRGPLLNWLGLCKLRIETAGGGSGTGDGSAKLIGLVDAKEFQELILAQRDREVSRAQLAAPAPAPAGDQAVLAEILGVLQRIEKRLAPQEG